MTTTAQARSVLTLAQAAAAKEPWRGSIDGETQLLARTVTDSLKRTTYRQSQSIDVEKAKSQSFPTRLTRDLTRLSDLISIDLGFLKDWLFPTSIEWD